MVILLKTLLFFLKLGNLDKDLTKRIPDLWTLVKNSEFFGCSGAIAMNLTVCKQQVENQWRQQLVIMITVHTFSYLKRDDLIYV